MPARSHKPYHVGSNPTSATDWLVALFGPTCDPKVSARVAAVLNGLGGFVPSGISAAKTRCRHRSAPSSFGKGEPIPEREKHEWEAPIPVEEWSEGKVDELRKSHSANKLQENGHEKMIHYRQSWCWWLTQGLASRRRRLL